MKKTKLIGWTVVGAVAIATAGLITQMTFAHCQVPCGIYDDTARIKQLSEDATTIDKAIKLINQLAEEMESGQPSPKYINQSVRWITTKEAHASNIIKVVSEYFLTQKVKPVAPDAQGYKAYLKKLADHHAVMVAAMKCKQDANPQTVTKLRNAIHNLEHYYNSNHKH